MVYCHVLLLHTVPHKKLILVKVLEHALSALLGAYLEAQIQNSLISGPAVISLNTVFSTGNQFNSNLVLDSLKFNRLLELQGES